MHIRNNGIRKLVLGNSGLHFKKVGEIWKEKKAQKIEQHE